MRLSFTLLFVMFVFWGACLGQGTKQTFSLSISAPANDIKAGSEVVLELIKTNISNQDIQVASVGERLLEVHYRIDVRDSKNAPANKTEHARNNDRLRSGSVVAGILKPGEKMQEKFTLSHIYDLSQPGEYTIQMQQTDNVSKIVVKSNIITITVTP